MKPYVSYHDLLMRDLKDPKEAQGYLNAALEEGDEKLFLVALKNVLDARGGLSKFSRQTKLNRVSLYRMLSRQGNPEWASIISLLRALGIQFRLTGKKPTTLHKKAA
ncbi:MAG: putative addiction module antidote protein [Omnitrophica bacterium RIFCSPLOWO2_12_FULL_44_17]|uniref:Putative addiction module antidote protein n=1 Tax=Candidatus Danuiimicrobium aquiferis TaxID=1801832 RepID=A0A1G1KYT8_9BACT|nr:MAG: putative addiction module antidote protein [Omnitrophica bacterium RIFCSPHIGHO2_02_FULL_45_28]OGW92155.1 MAG: putative addiction module antidote protein [Omnitrophica bacterium RIFCSPHIGHO2_12_FULL_44_12]OGW98067.1 MAG: putative addiction module antidote protein [Omnitrophica bacterium RIFCSPLOWO2_12_FULL_44_17]OGX03491.1 MAG: putative addiction module antidote protein [Omnitrophica bacterium RIFCSPLOWO2_02_FULL_44_11]